MPDPQDAAQLLEALALTGATTAAAAMATDAWQTARGGLAHLFRRTGRARQHAVTAQLDANAALVARAAGTERARSGVVSLWQVELEEFLREYPEAADELQVLVGRIRASLPEDHGAWVQANIARDNGHVFAAQGPGSNVIVHQGSPDQIQPLVPGEQTRSES